MKINTYTIDELGAYLNSDKYKRSDTLPVSPHRAVSYKNNPRADASKPVLFTVEEEDQLIAYRTLLPDQFFIDDTPKPFAWLSGNYVSPEHRRKGISTKLFSAVEEAWEGRLMYTNYAPASKAVYDKTGVFSIFHQRQGARYYMRSSMQTLLKHRVGGKPVLGFADKILNGLHDGRIRKAKFNIPDDILVKPADFDDEDTAALISEHSSHSLFRRSSSEMSWICSYPWVTTNSGNKPTGNYHFSWLAAKFENFLYRLEDKNNGQLAFLWINIHNEKLSLPYLFSSSEKLIFASRQLVLEHMVKHQCAYFSTWHPELAPTLKSKNTPFLLSKKMPQRYFVHDKLKGELPEFIELYDGDGDCAFS